MWRATAQTHAVFGSLYQTIFEAAWLLRGMEPLLQDMVINKDFAHALFDRLLALFSGGGRRAGGAGCRCVVVG